MSRCTIMRRLKGFHIISVHSNTKTCTIKHIHIILLKYFLYNVAYVSQVYAKLKI